MSDAGSPALGAEASPASKRGCLFPVSAEAIALSDGRARSSP